MEKLEQLQKILNELSSLEDKYIDLYYEIIINKDIDYFEDFKEVIINK